ncbi:DegT/DnrJ/EryC1/StrS family aminotransferase [Brevibacillus brevis]|uniref:DegT/DnrJ/EryC1/StrS family aminotransferase n=1 Tax=Brevibacillus brevis TaxID=1393 RepID=UPI000D0EC177|nr:DegT/DnrJ/EryC1/StrS family aminotransferase [Brevibacillus brevis]PSJ67291.1 erythromycin biosynthesis sensory transduction protein eryC1 [Brevibacillus brevis]RED21633.1 dTDP-4-amino-4,6-dideoxygalactose transaminase [Brevibacillus brevis]GEC91882.1 aminotransferase [Brevibacillus brevis]VEF86695.1 UDP-4-amino-4-deoxy-L-arabinose--oxoglutarate aminotransferase [Brevibacillus brevis]
MSKIPILDLQQEIQFLREKLFTAFEDVLQSGQFIMGPQVKALESELADFLGVKHAITLNSGTDALVIGLRALGIGEGDEVITTPFTFYATAEAIQHVGASTVFADIDPVTFNIKVDGLEEKITNKTKAIIPVHLFGQAVQMDALMSLAKKYDLKIIEDVAQAFGGTFGDSMLGTVGDVGCFSFFPSKNLGAYGDGGLLTTNDDKVAEVAKMLRSHGSKKKYYNELVGYNSRLDEMQAAILRVKLPYIKEWNGKRRQAASYYTAALKDLPGIVTPEESPQCTHVFHQYTIRVSDDQRELLKTYLEEQGISTMVYYPTPVHKLPIFSEIHESYSESEQAAAEVLSLPIWPNIQTEVQDQVITAIKNFFKR